MAYAGYEFYNSLYYGKMIPEDDFPYYAERATEYIDSLNIINPDEFKLSKACCACAEVIYKAQPENQITAEKVGDYSVSYNSNQSNTADELHRAVIRYLDIQSVGWI